MNRKSTCCFTGHRVIRSADAGGLERRLDETVAELIRQGIVSFLSGMAVGFDMMASRAVLNARQGNTAIQLSAVLPCRNQGAYWNERDKQEYRSLLGAADKIIYVSERPYFDGCMKERNLRLVEESCVCVAYMIYGRSGTAQTVRLAHERGLKVINLAEKRDR